MDWYLLSSFVCSLVYRSRFRYYHLLSRRTASNTERKHSFDRPSFNCFLCSSQKSSDNPPVLFPLDCFAQINPIFNMAYTHWLICDEQKVPKSFVDNVMRRGPTFWFATTGARERETLAPIAASCATQNHGRALLFYQQESFFSWRDVFQPNCDLAWLESGHDWDKFHVWKHLQTDVVLTAKHIIVISMNPKSILQQACNSKW